MVHACIIPKVHSVIMPFPAGCWCTGVSCLDALGMALFLAFVIFATFQSRRFVRSVEKQTLEVSDYSVLVQGLPPDASVQEVCCFVVHSHFIHKSDLSRRHAA